jgi:hydroxyacylglutathione hydrolase
MAENVKADFDLVDLEKIQLGSHEIVIFHTPGHTPGSICLRFGSRAIVGDAIFPGGPGHTHTPNELDLSLKSLRRVVFSWPDDTRLFPGHGDSTTVGQERPGFTRFIAETLPVDLCGDVSWAS